MQQPKLAYSKKQAAAEISLSVRTIDYLIQRGDLAAKKFGEKVLIPGEALASLIRKGIKGNPSRVNPKAEKNDP
jgi:excisionase family DNA binding protein